MYTVCLSALCVSLSLLQVIGEFVAGQSLWAVLAIFCGLVLVGTTFISHTVGAMVILPIVQSVGDHMPGNHSKLLVMGAALMCSGGWRLGSGFRVQVFGSNPTPKGWQARVRAGGPAMSLCSCCEAPCASRHTSGVHAARLDRHAMASF